MSDDHSRPDEHAAQEFQFHPFADIFPMMDEVALAELAADIKAESQREPIHLWQDQIIDGRNRYRGVQARRGRAGHQDASSSPAASRGARLRGEPQPQAAAFERAAADRRDPEAARAAAVAPGVATSRSPSRSASARRPCGALKQPC